MLRLLLCDKRSLYDSDRLTDTGADLDLVLKERKSICRSSSREAGGVDGLPVALLVVGVRGARLAVNRVQGNQFARVVGVRAEVGAAVGVDAPIGWVSSDRYVRLAVGCGRAKQVSVVSNGAIQKLGEKAKRIELGSVMFEPIVRIETFGGKAIDGSFSLLVLGEALLLAGAVAGGEQRRGALRVFAAAAEVVVVVAREKHLVVGARFGAVGLGVAGHDARLAAGLLRRFAQRLAPQPVEVLRRQLLRRAAHERLVPEQRVEVQVRIRAAAFLLGRRLLRLGQDRRRGLAQRVRLVLGDVLLVGDVGDLVLGGAFGDPVALELAIGEQHLVAVGLVLVAVRAVTRRRPGQRTGGLRRLLRLRRLHAVGRVLRTRDFAILAAADAVPNARHPELVALALLTWTKPHLPLAKRSLRVSVTLFAPLANRLSSILVLLALFAKQFTPSKRHRHFYSISSI